MADVVNIEEVGQAESVIQRLINERKALENAQQVLQTYRMVKSELQPALDELAHLKQIIVQERRELAAVEGQKVNALARVKEEVDGYRARQVEQVETEMAKKVNELTVLEGELEELGRVRENDKAIYEKECREYSLELEKLKKELVEVKGEHGALAEAIGKAAGFFSSVRGT